MNRTLSVLALAATVSLASGAAMADDDYGTSRRGPDVAPVKHALYRDECGSCHFAYQPGLLQNLANPLTRTSPPDAGVFFQISRRVFMIAPD